MLLEQISRLVRVCDQEERELIETMILTAADYVRSVVHMETIGFHYTGQTGEKLRSALSQADRHRRTTHDALISYVDIVNRLCSAHQLPPIYTDGNQRKLYGDFALQLSTEIFQQR